MNFATKTATLTVFLFASGFCNATNQALGQANINILSMEGTTLSESGSKLPNENSARDGNSSTAAKAEIHSAKTLDLVYDFGEQTVTARKLSIATTGLKANVATIEVLASNSSPETGFRTVRVEPLRGSRDSAQSFGFEPFAARWIMVRFASMSEEPEPLRFKIRELEIAGYVGTPKSIYQFDESPAEAFKVLAKLSDSIELKISDEEEKLFEDARDGTLDTTSFEEAALLSCGIENEQQRKQLLQTIDRFADECEKLIPADLPAFERGKRLLQWLHAGPLKNGYIEKQTDVSTALKDQTYNCVSSATLYNILARRLGLDARGIEVPDHAFSILYDGTQHADIETTNKHGFNPARNRRAIESLQQTTGFVYIPDSNRAKRREVGEAGLIALTYYNHGVSELKSKQYGDALLSFFKALSLDPNNKSAVKNVLATLGSWSEKLFKEGNTQRSLEVLAVGRELAPKDRNLKHNQRAIWQQHIKQLVEDGEAKSAFTQLAAAFETTKDEELAKLQTWVFIEQGEKLVKQQDWAAALSAADDGLLLVNELARKDLERWRTSALLRWSRKLFEQKKFAQAIDAIDQRRGDNGSYMIDQRLGYLTQEWSRHAKTEDGIEAGYEIINKLAERFPKNSVVQRVRNQFVDEAAKAYLDAENYEKALEVYATARKLDPKDYHLRQNQEAVWFRMAKPHHQSRDWKKAIDIYERANKQLPKSHGFKKNLAYAVQEWAADVKKQKGVAEAEAVIQQMAARFPNLPNIQQMKGTQIGRELSRLIKAKEFDAAHELIIKHRDAWYSEHRLKQSATYLYHQQAKPAMNENRWEDAITIFENGYKAFPDNYDIKKNLEFAWISRAKRFIDDESWAEAIAVYKNALKMMPDNSKFKKNLRYCESKSKQTD